MADVEVNLGLAGERSTGVVLARHYQLGDIAAGPNSWVAGQVGLRLGAVSLLLPPSLQPVIVLGGELADFTGSFIGGNGAPDAVIILAIIGADL